MSILGSRGQAFIELIKYQRRFLREYKDCLARERIRKIIIRKDIFVLLRLSNNLLNMMIYIRFSVCYPHSSTVSSRLRALAFKLCFKLQDAGCACDLFTLLEECHPDESTRSSSAGTAHSSSVAALRA